MSRTELPVAAFKKLKTMGEHQPNRGNFHRQTLGADGIQMLSPTLQPLRTPRKAR